jgi:hypothetical protein
VKVGKTSESPRDDRVLSHTLKAVPFRRPDLIRVSLEDPVDLPLDATFR